MFLNEYKHTYTHTAHNKIPYTHANTCTHTHTYIMYMHTHARV